MLFSSTTMQCGESGTAADRCPTTPPTNFAATMRLLKDAPIGVSIADENPPLGLGIDGSEDVGIFQRGTGLSRQDNRSFSAAYARQHVSSFFLLSCQSSFHVHLNCAA